VPAGHAGSFSNAPRPVNVRIAGLVLLDIANGAFLYELASWPFLVRLECKKNGFGETIQKSASCGRTIVTNVNAPTERGLPAEGGFAINQ
jgi:hypothetical protein